MNKLYNDTAVQAIANAIRAKNGSSDTYNIAEMSTALNDLSYYAKPSISNVALATFEASALPMPSLKVSVEAKQDLHGYDKPWVGGAGKNKCPINDIEVGGNTEEAITDKIPIGSQKTFVISMNVARINGVAITNNALYVTQIITYDSNDVQVDTISPSPITLESGSTTFQTSFTVSDNASYMIINLRNRNGDGNKNTRKYNIQLENGSQPTSFEPYSNICPISGWDEAVVSDVDDVDNPTVTQTTTISLPQTVYGGEVDVVNGVSGNKITDVLQTITSVIRNNGTSYYVIPTQGAAKGENFTTVISDKLPTASNTSAVGVYINNVGAIRINTPDSYESASEMMQAYGGEINVRYELETPTTFTTSPTPIKSLEGTNNLSVDCGEVIELEYFKEV